VILIANERVKKTVWGSQVALQCPTDTATIFFPWRYTISAEIRQLSFLSLKKQTAISYRA
jgi:hypothetical protein